VGYLALHRDKVEEEEEVLTFLIIQIVQYYLWLVVEVEVQIMVGEQIWDNNLLVMLLLVPVDFQHLIMVVEPAGMVAQVVKKTDKALEVLVGILMAVMAPILIHGGPPQKVD
jgi:hypothetical protein